MLHSQVLKANSNNMYSTSKVPCLKEGITKCSNAIKRNWLIHVSTTNVY